MGEHFSMSWDASVRLTTLIAVVLVVVASAGTAWLLWRGGTGVGVPRIVGLLLPMAGVLALPCIWAYAPRAITIDGRTLRVERLVGPVSVPLTDVRAVGPAPRGAMAGAIRTWGSGGLFGYFGLHRSRRLGRFALYATSRSGHVLVEAGGTRLVLTPDDPERFVEVLLHAASGAVRLDPSTAPDG